MRSIMLASSLEEFNSIISVLQRLYIISSIILLYFTNCPYTFEQTIKPIMY